MGRLAVTIRTLTLATSVVAATSVMFASTVAAAPATGSISGTITSAQSDTGVGGICVTVDGEMPFKLPVNTSTAADGSYSVSNLPNGSYQVTVDPTCQGRLTSNLEIFTFPKFLTISSGAALTNVDVSLAAGGTITGTVTSAQSGQGIPDICLGASSTMPSGSSVPIGGAETTSDGTYVVSNLAAGSYTMIFDSSCYGGAGSSYSAQTLPQPINVAAGSTTTDVNVQLGPASMISGTVTDALTHSGIAGSIVYADWASGPFTGHQAGSTYTNAAGSYVISGLETGTYIVSCDGGMNESLGHQERTPPYDPESLPKPLSVTSGSSATDENFYLYASSYTLTFARLSGTLSSSEKLILSGLAKIIVPRSLILITGFASNNVALANKRALAVASYLGAKVKIDVSLRTQTGSTDNVTTVFLDGGTMDVASK
jgi:hypothetical protein